MGDWWDNAVAAKTETPTDDEFKLGHAAFETLRGRQPGR